jgi:hypothetical protein
MISSRNDPLAGLENAQGALSGAQERLRCVALRVTSRMRTRAELEEVNEINLARTEIVVAQRYLAQQHPQGVVS